MSAFCAGHDGSMNRGVLVLAGVVFMGCMLAGCSSQDFGRPIARVADALDSGKPYVESDDEAAVARTKQLGQMLIEWEKAITQGDRDYIVGSDDVLEVGILSIEKPDEITPFQRQVRKDGKITLPLLGDVQAGGLTIRDLEAGLVGALHGRFLKNPSVSVKVVDYRSLPVVITGAVTKPGVYYLRRNVSSVLEVLSLAQGLASTAGDRLMIVRSEHQGQDPDRAGDGQPVVVSDVPAVKAVETGGGPLMVDAGMAVAEPDADSPEPEQEATAQMIEVDLRKLLGQGDVRLNVVVMGGDIISVPPLRKNYMYVLGYVQSPGAFEIESDKQVDVLQAVARAGGLAASARAQNSYLVRDQGGKRLVVDVDLTKIARGVRPPLYLRSGDTLIVGSSVLAKLGEFVKPSIGASASLAPIP